MVKIGKQKEEIVTAPKSVDPIKFFSKKAASKKASPKKSKSAMFLAIIIFLVMLTALGATTFYFYRQYKKAIIGQDVISGKEERVPQEAQSIKEAVGKIIELPEGEEPTMATVTDVEKIKSQPFFAKAQNGDKVLIYTKSAKAILYRPFTGKIVEVSVVSGTGNEVAPAPAESQAQNVEVNTEEADPNAPVENNSASVEAPAKVAVYNGGKTNGLAQKIADSLSEMTGIEIVEKTNATSKYQKTLVVDISGSRQELAQKIAETLEGEVAAMPEGELKPDADILIIGGRDFKIE